MATVHGERYSLGFGLTVMTVFCVSIDFRRMVQDPTDDKSPLI